MLVLSLQVSCGNNTQNERLKSDSHPDLRLIDVPHDVLKQNIKVKEVDINQGVFSNFLTINSIGKEFGNADDTFGRIEHAIFDERKRLYVLDSIRQNIKVFNYNGKLLTILGGRGHGPGEFAGARSMLIHENKLYVANRFRIEVFKIDKEIPEYYTSIVIEHNIRDFCVVSGTLFIHNIQMLEGNSNTTTDKDHGIQSSIIHSYSLPDFEYISSFGNSYKTNNYMILENLSVGKLMCDNKTENIYISFERMPVIKKFDLIGNLIWVSTFDDLNFSKMVETEINGRSAIQNVIDGNFVDRFYNVISINNNDLFIQFQRAVFNEEDRSLGAQEVLTLSFLINKEQGSGRFLGFDQPLIINKFDNYILNTNTDQTIIDINLYN